jgi:hypothetical protein
MEKQIIEMSEEILQEYTNCYSKADQKCLEKMLRKLASEVAEEIFAKIEKLIARRMIPDVALIDDRLITDIAELKIKYTEEGK